MTILTSREYLEKYNQANQARKPASPINRAKFEKLLVADVAPEEKDKL
jgi:hypothetical protein